MNEPWIRDIAKHHGKTPAQVLLRWQVQQEGVVAIPKSANRQRILENIAIFDFVLTEAEMQTLFSLALLARELKRRSPLPAAAPA